MHLNAFDMTCVAHQSPGLWRHPKDQSYRYKDIDYWTDLAQLLDRGGFTSLFIADVVGVYDVYSGSARASIVGADQIPVNDPLMQVSAMAAVTSRLGFAITVSSTYEKPYAFARKMSTLDHLTKGRVGWNIVTSYLESAARNLGLDHQVPHDHRYELAEEFLEVCYKLWEYSWDDDAVIRDTAAGTFTRPDKIREINHKGIYFEVPGYHLSEPSPQRTPLLFQAGASPRGIDFAVRHAEAIFITGTRPAVLRPKVDRIRRKLEASGRDPRSVKTFPLVTVITGENDEEARAKHRDFLKYAHYDGALALYGGWSGLDLSGYDPDQPLKYIETEAVRSAVEAFTTADPDRTWTPREVASWVTVGGMGPVIIGGPATVADELERWADQADVDGFNLAYAITPGTFEDLVTHVVPELRRRGRLGAGDASGPTLRDAIVGQPRLRDDLGSPSVLGRWAPPTVQHQWLWGDAVNPIEPDLTLTPDPRGYLLSGHKTFATGASVGDVIVVTASSASDVLLVVVGADAGGVEFGGDWDNLGQRLSASGSVTFTDVEVPHDNVIGSISAPTPLASMITPAIQAVFGHLYLGIAEGALEAARAYTLSSSRPWVLGGQSSVTDEPYVLSAYGDFASRLAAVGALADAVAVELDATLDAGASLIWASRGSVAERVAALKVVSTDVALDVTAKIFEVTGARSTANRYGFDRFWRDVRTHTLHDPVAYKRREVGLHYLTGATPDFTLYT